MENKNEFLEALRNRDQEAMNKVVSDEMKQKAGEKVSELESNITENFFAEKMSNYDKVFKAVAAHFDLDPDEVNDSSKADDVYSMIEKCWDEDSDSINDACPIDISENVNEITDYSSDELHGSGGEVDGPSKQMQNSAANAAYKMAQLQATNFNQMMSDVYSQDPDRARAFQDMIANNPGESTMKTIANQMMDNSDLAKVMKKYIGDYEVETTRSDKEKTMD